tara:strand:- start:1228 stop:1359 length:132 start_codon:yes stop_codon:yes gene_type:complete
MNEYMMEKIRNAPPNKTYFTYEEVYMVLKREYPEVMRDILRRL